MFSSLLLLLWPGGISRSVGATRGAGSGGPVGASSFGATSAGSQAGKTHQGAPLVVQHEHGLGPNYNNDLS